MEYLVHIGIFTRKMHVHDCICFNCKQHLILNFIMKICQIMLFSEVSSVLSSILFLYYRTMTGLWRAIFYHMLQNFTRNHSKMTASQEVSS